MLSADEIYNLDGYVWRISMNVYARFVSQKKRHEGISIDGMDIPFQDEYSFEGEDELIPQLRIEIAFLTKVRRQIVYAHYFENKTVSAIAAEMNIPVGTVKWHLSQSRNELKEGFKMERKIGKLGLKPVEVTNFGHSGNADVSSDPEFFLGDKINLNIVYSVYFAPKTKEEIAEELGLTLVFIEDKVDFLESNGYLVRQSKNRYTEFSSASADISSRVKSGLCFSQYTTYVSFSPETYTVEEIESRYKKQYEAAKILVNDYVPVIRKAIADFSDAYIPGGNMELLEACAIFSTIAEKCRIHIPKDLSKYRIKPAVGGDYIAMIDLVSTQTDPGYVMDKRFRELNSCGSMIRASDKYPIRSWSVDTKYCTRKGTWKNNHTADYEYLYELMTGQLADTPANAEKMKRLRERKFITSKNQVNIMVVKGKEEEFWGRIPKPDEHILKMFADEALESAEMVAKKYPPQMHDLIIAREAGGFIGYAVAVMVLDILYGNGTFRPLTKNEKVTSLLIMFSDRLP
jgi:DNA-directed RNA polymerase specialized sigma subunit